MSDGMKMLIAKSYKTEYLLYEKNFSYSKDFIYNYGENFKFKTNGHYTSILKKELRCNLT